MHLHDIAVRSPQDSTPRSLGHPRGMQGDTMDFQGSLVRLRGWPRQRPAVTLTLTQVLGAAKAQHKMLLGDVQADMVELQGGLVGWRIERLAQTEANGHSVAVRMGPFFRLKLEIPGDGPVSGVLELTQPGKAATSPACFRPM